jgi:hypothetical protein
VKNKNKNLILPLTNVNHIFPPIDSISLSAHMSACGELPQNDEKWKLIFHLLLFRVHARYFYLYGESVCDGANLHGWKWIWNWNEKIAPILFSFSSAEHPSVWMKIKWHRKFRIITMIGTYDSSLLALENVQWKSHKACCACLIFLR